MQFVTGPVDDWKTHRSTVASPGGARQPVHRPSDQGGFRTDPRGRADQPERDVLSTTCMAGLRSSSLAMPTGRARVPRRCSTSCSPEALSETVPLGTVRTANLPVSVNFDDYNYWGIEGGQRFFFARVRFSPFVGYLIGANRHGDIRAEFVNVPRQSPARLCGAGPEDLREVLGVQRRSHRRPGRPAWARSRFWVKCSSDSWAACLMSIGSSRRACATSTPRASAGRYRSSSARA